LLGAGAAIGILVLAQVLAANKRDGGPQSHWGWAVCGALGGVLLRALSVGHNGQRAGKDQYGKGPSPSRQEKLARSPSFEIGDGLLNSQSISFLKTPHPEPCWRDFGQRAVTYWLGLILNTSVQAQP
jgi:hypothetical protein